MMRPTAAPFAARNAATTSWPGVRKRIVDQRTLKAWQKSPAYRDVLTFVHELSAAAEGQRLTEGGSGTGPRVRAIMEALDKLSGWIADIPPLKQAMRYGNPAFKLWYARLVQHAPAMMQSLLAVPAAAAGRTELPRTFIESNIPTRVAFEASLKLPDEQRWQAEQAAAATPAGGSATLAASSSSSAGDGPALVAPSTAAGELAAYFAESFGNATRIDYGTGHELSFVVWLRCLDRMGVLSVQDRSSVVLLVFQRYLTLMRELQTTYWLEPAGSHGVWGLDDYQFLPFLFGAAQLVSHPEISPSSIHEESTLRTEGDAYFYLAAVAFIRRVKKGPFGEHSPMLNDISGLRDWRAVASGLSRMYEGEVLGKLPVVQHLPFGTLLSWPADTVTVS